MEGVPVDMTPPVSESRSEEPRRDVTSQPTHNWRPTVVHGAALWLLLSVAAALPLGGPLSLGIAALAVLAAPMFPVSLYCDYRQARARGECEPGVAAYARNLWRDVVTTVARRTPLGSERRLLDC